MSDEMSGPDNSDDPLVKVRQLKKAVQRKAKELHLNVEQFVIQPGNPDKIQVVFKISPEAVQTADEQIQSKFDDDFESLFKSELKDLSDPENPAEEPEEFDPDKKTKLEEWFD